MKRKSSSPKFAICLDNSGYPASLELHKIYCVVPDADTAVDGDLRVIDESGEDYLYPASYFLVVELPRDTKRILADSFSRRVQPAAA